MAYPIPPGPRIAYDADGTLGFVSGIYTGPGVHELHPGFLRAMNADSPRVGATEVTTLRAGTSVNYLYSSLDFPPAHLVVLRFPEPMRIRALAAGGIWGVYASGAMSGVAGLLFRVETSDDSTNGVDGTWSTLYVVDSVNMFPWVAARESRGDETYGFTSAISGNTGSTTQVYLSVNSNYRKQRGGPGEPGWEEVHGSASRQVTWLRLVPYQISDISISTQMMPILGAWYKLHLYGEPDTAASDNRLVFTDAGGVLKQSFDWGDVGQGSSHAQTFRVKNLSGSLTASGIQISIQPPDPNVLESPQTWLQLSPGGGVWDTTLDLGDLGPGESSDPITLRLQTGTNLVGPSGPRLFVAVEEWS